MEVFFMSPEETSTFNVTHPAGSQEVPGRRLVGSVALIGAGMLLEPELLGGALIGAGVVYGLPLIGQIVRPVATTAVQLGYAAVASVGDLSAGARDQIQGIVTNARAGYQGSRGASIISKG
jgi:hypothetical protein